MRRRNSSADPARQASLKAYGALQKAVRAYLDAYEAASSAYERQFGYEDVLKTVAHICELDREAYEDEF